MGRYINTHADGGPGAAVSFLKRNASSRGWSPRRTAELLRKWHTRPREDAGPAAPHLTAAQKCEADRFIQDAAMAEWLSEANRQKGLAPSGLAIVSERQRRARLRSDAGLAEARDVPAMATPSAGRHWLRRWTRRWHIRRGTIAAGPVLPVEIRRQKDAGGSPGSHLDGDRGQRLEWLGSRGSRARVTSSRLSFTARISGGVLGPASVPTQGRPPEKGTQNQCHKSQPSAACLLASRVAGPQGRRHVEVGQSNRGRTPGGQAARVAQFRRDSDSRGWQHTARVETPPI